MSTHVRLWPIIALLTGCGNSPSPAPDAMADVEQRILQIHDATVTAMVAGTSTAEFITSDWRGVNLNGTPMSNEGFEGGQRVMEYDSIQIIDRDVRVYGEVAALQWHGHFFVKVNGQPSYAEMRLLDIYVLREGTWRNDLTQVTPVYGSVGNPPGN
jgi:hypothetical protein